MSTSPKIYTLAASQPFLKTLAQGLLARYGEDGALAEVKILLPTRRSCRNLQEAFLDLTDKDALMLPEMRPLGEYDPSELAFQSALHELAIEDIPPAISQGERDLLLTRLISQVPRFSGNTPQALAMARSLSQLLDQVYTENLSLEALESIVPDKLADNWKLSLAFLDILRTSWPDILAERGVIDPADRRARLMRATLELWEKAPPEGPVIAAGSTGSIPLTADLLGLISRLPRGEIILPGFDTQMDKASWDALEEGHPHFTMKKLLERIEVDFADVHLWRDAPKLDDAQKGRETLWREVMRPAETSAQWSEGALHLPDKALDGLHIIAADTPEEEAHVIALALREALEDKEEQRTAAFVTPDRTLAARVHAHMRRWDIKLDDSAGQPLSQTRLGDYLLKILHVARDRFTPIALFSLLQHPYAQFGLDEGKAASLGAALARHREFRGFWSEHKFKKLLQDDTALPEHLRDFLNGIHQALLPLRLALHNAQGEIDLKSLMQTHLQVAEEIATSDQMHGKARLWRGEAGEEAANFFADLLENLQSFEAHFHENTGELYTAFLKSQMGALIVRPAFGTHPRLAILGQLEARLMQADLIILGGLNEGTWPSLPDADPWMSRPMRKSFGLPAPERAFTLSAHDFVQGASAPNVLFTRAVKSDGVQTVPARWLQRLDIVLKTSGRTLDQQNANRLLEYARQMHRDAAGKGILLDAPYPVPPVEARPKVFSASSLELLMRDPYGLYAKSVLKLRPLDPYEEEAGPRERGIFIHAVAGQFCETYPRNIPENAEAIFIEIAKEIFTRDYNDEALYASWWPRLEELAGAFIAHEKEWRAGGYHFEKSEKEGALQKGAYTFTAIADRLDAHEDGTYAVIDYKTGSKSHFTKKAVASGFLPQLPLEGLILAGDESEAPVFDGLVPNATSYMGYWLLGIKGGLDFAHIERGDKAADIIANTDRNLDELMRAYEDPERGYPCQPFNKQEPKYSKYDHLARLLEWKASASNESGEAA